MEQLNLFHKGIVSGLDYSLVKNDSWVFPSQNIRIVNREGKGLIVTLLKGVEKEFSLSEGYECIGAVSFDQIIYVVSYSKTKRLCEIGCYPSPASYSMVSGRLVINPGVEGFEAIYKPLPNYFSSMYVGGPKVRKPFIVNKLPYNEKNILDIIAVPSYDESIDLLILDGVNANKMINTGFDKQGRLTTRTISEEDFSGVLDLVKTSEKYPYVKDFLPGVSSDDPFFAGNSINQVFNQIVASSQSTTINWGLTNPQRVKMDKEVVFSDNYNVISGNGQYQITKSGLHKFGVYAQLLVRSYYPLSIPVAATYNCNFILNLIRDRNGAKSTVATVTQNVNTGSITHIQVQLSIGRIELSLMAGDLLYVELNASAGGFTNPLSFPASFDLEIANSGTYWFLNTEVDNTSSIQINSGGKLLPGNYFLFLRYSTFDYNRTQFITSIGPLSVYENNKLGDIEGSKYDIPTTKKIDLVLDNLDLSYDYFEIGVVRYFGELGYMQRDVYLISNKYSTRDSNLTITGHEDQASLDFAEVGNHQGIEKICKTHRIINNRYYGANWTGLNANYQQLAELALKAKVRYTLSEKIIDTSIDQLEGSLPEVTNPELFYGYKSIQNIVKKAGYRRGAVIPFGIQFLLNDDTRTPAFAVTGYDCYDGTYKSENQKGLFRFPFYKPTPESGDELPINDIKNILGVRFEMDDFMQYFNDNQLSSVVKGIIFSRGNEVENLLYQGVACHMVNGVRQASHEAELEANVSFPIVQTGFPILRYRAIGDPQDYSDASYGYINTGSLGTSLNQYILAMYSPDLLFSQVNKTFAGRKYYLQIIGDSNPTVPSQQIRKQSTLLGPAEYVRDIQSFRMNPKVPMAVDTIIVDRGSNPQFGDKIVLSKAFPGDFFQRYQKQGETYDIYQNRTMVSPKYMAINMPESLTSVYTNMNYLVNIYSEDPTLPDYFSTLVQNYNPYNKIYSPFSAPVVGIANIQQLSYSLFGGNSFQTRMYFRQNHWEELFDISEKRGDDPGHLYFAHGLLMGMFVESLCNPALRHGDNENTYYPKLRLQKVMNGLESIDGNALEWIMNDSNFYIYESFFYNSGYHKDIADSLMYGYDPQIPFMRKRYPGRIRASAKHNDNSFMSGYSIFSQQNFVDFDKQIGEINYLGSVNDELISVSDSRIIQHYIDERAVYSEDGDKSLILGHGPIISEQYKVLAEYGSQHRNGVKNFADSIYGIDIRARVIWTILGQTSQFGKVILGAKNLSMDNMIESELDNIYKSLGIVSNKIVPFGDNTIVGSGVTIGCDPIEKEVYFVFKKETDLITLVYSEKIQAFTGRMDNVSPYFVNANDQLMSYFNGSFYRHNTGDKKHDGSTIIQELSFIVNGLNEEQNTMAFYKVLESIAMEMPQYNLLSITYETEDQFAEKVPFNSGTDKYDDPVYENGRWTVPTVLSSIAEGQFNPSSELFGSWIKITLKWTANSNIFIRSIRSFFKILLP